MFVRGRHKKAISKNGALMPVLRAGLAASGPWQRLALRLLSIDVPCASCCGAAGIFVKAAGPVRRTMQSEKQPSMAAAIRFGFE